MCTVNFCPLIQHLGLHFPAFLQKKKSFNSFLSSVSKCLFWNFFLRFFHARMSSACTLFSSAHLQHLLKALLALSCHIVRIIGGVLDSCSFLLLLSSSTLLIISSSVMIWRFSSSLQLANYFCQQLLAWWAFSHSSAIASWRSEVRAVPSFSDSSGPVSSLLPEDSGREGHVCHNWTSWAHIKPTSAWKVLYSIEELKHCVLAAV
jgi:hypothetical protein